MIDIVLNWNSILVDVDIKNIIHQMIYTAIHYERYKIEWKINIGWCGYYTQKNINSSNGLHGNSSW